MADTRTDADRRAAATHDDLIHIIGEIDNGTAAAILALGPTVAEVEQAFMWISGEGAVVDRSGHPLAGKTAAIVDILAAEMPEEEEE
ncbi:MAG: hypothetical protein Q8P46_11535 [Hyphomicrobiales bacterium]|jgi:hypothetical protein|nr:hypothetical protein [Hyphomicrobiales bacterium]